MASVTIIPSGKRRADIVDEANLYRVVVLDWENLGANLRLNKCDLGCISRDNAHNPDRTKGCCRAVLKKWLELECLPTWGKLEDAINAINNPPIANNDTAVIVINQLSSHVKAVYRATKFNVVNDMWTPEQSKEFTPLVLLHHEDEHSMENVTAITKALHTGTISNIISATTSDRLHDYSKLGEALKARKTTIDISEILATVEVSDKLQSILVEGIPGIGKTILLKHIAFSWAEQEMLQKYELVLLVHLRDPTVQKMSNPEQLFQYFCKPFGSKAASIAVTCNEYFFGNNGKTLAFILDGYDELPKEARVNGLIADILNRQVLPDCYLVVSSRPHASMLLRKQATLLVDILGFTEKQTKHYIEHSLNDQSQIKQLTTYLEQHSIISGLCYVPFNVALLLFLYKQRVPLANLVTKLYSILIWHAICRYLTKNGITVHVNKPITDIKVYPEPYNKFIQQLSKLSLQVLNNNQLFFTLDEIKQYCPEVENMPGVLNAFGLLQGLDHDTIFQTKLNFYHLSVQEFLAANHITTLTPDEELSILNKHFWTDRYSNMFTIYINLTKGQRLSFRKFLYDGNHTITIHSKILHDKLKSIQLYRCFIEGSGDDYVCRTIEEMFSDGIIDLPFKILSINNIYNITTLLSCSSIKQWKALDLWDCHIQDEGLHIMHQTISSSIIIEQFWLGYNDLSFFSNGCLADIVITCEVKLLAINGNKTIGQTEEFFHTILSPPSKIEELWIACIKLSNKVAIMIFTLMKETKTKLKILHMADNDITADACNIIAETLKVNSTLEYLNIHGNKITKEAIQLIVHSLKYNSTLTQLNVPGDYSDDDKVHILHLGDIVNEERKRLRYQVLSIKFTYV